MTRIPVGLECLNCGFGNTMLIDATDAEVGNDIGYACVGCNAVRTQVITHQYDEPARSRLSDLMG